MYISHYIFYKVDYSNPGVHRYHDLHVMEFTTPQEEHSYCREQRAEGYFTKHLNVDLYRIFEAALSSAR